MCGRFTLTERDVASLARAWQAEVDGALAAGWRPRYNVAPGDRHPVVRATAAGRRLEPAVFGLPAPDGTLQVNARVETAGSRPAFRDAWRLRRCAVPADGFFEWDGPADARRPTWFHRADGRPLLLAAILGASRDDGLAFAILTTGANAEVRRLHDRMPVIVPEERLDAWLSGPPPVLAAPADGLLAERAVSAHVNSVENDDPGCLAPEPQLRLL